MSYDPNQPQPPDSGQQPQPPYGQPPSYYGQPGQPQQPPYGQPQPPYEQPQQPPYGQPQPPYEQQWEQQPPPYGQPGQQWAQQPPQDYAPTQNVAPAYGTQSVPGYMPPQQPRRSRRGLWIVLGIMGGVIVLSCAVCGILFATGAGIFGSILGSIAGPTNAVNQYYNAIEKQDYATAYSYIDQNLTAANGQPLTQQLYTLAAQGFDTVKGKVTNYSVKNVNTNTTKTTLTVTVTRANAPPYDVHLELQQVNGAWKITSYDNI